MLDYQPKKDGRNGRRSSLLSKFNNYSCDFCGEDENVALMYYPHHKKIRSLYLRHGQKHQQSRQEIEYLIRRSDVRCWYCAVKARYDLSFDVGF